MSSDTRRVQLQHWLATIFDVDTVEIRPASTDASFRRYFRFENSGRSYIAMDAPPGKEPIEPFVRIGERFHDLGLNVPRILNSDPEQGFVLLTDLGNKIYLQQLQLHADMVERLYGDALGALVVLQTATYTEPDFLPEYSEDLLREEMELFREWYLMQHLKHNLDDTQQQGLEDVFTLLAGSALAQPRVWVHRDFHSRNLMVTSVNNPGILDFQDAVLGPVTYDLVSLLKDCYISWSRDQILAWARGYYRLARQSGVPVGEDEDQFIVWFERMGVQRHLKASGIFARLYHRDGKAGFLDDIPRTLGYVMDVCRRDAALTPLSTLIDVLNIPYEELP